MKTRPLLLVSLALTLLFSCQTGKEPNLDHSPAPQPYPYIQAKASGSEVPESPDPLVAWRWEDPKAADELEIYSLHPVHITSTQPGSFENMESMALGKEMITVEGTGDLMIDFGQGDRDAKSHYQIYRESCRFYRPSIVLGPSRSRGLANGIIYSIYHCHFCLHFSLERCSETPQRCR